MEKFESAVQAGNISLLHTGEATPANTITVRSIDYSSGTTGNDESGAYEIANNSVDQGVSGPESAMSRVLTPNGAKQVLE